MRIIAKPIASALILFFALLMASASASAQDNCNLKGPPKAAAVDGEHGIYLFVYPGPIPESYTGCQTTWDERGNKWEITTFEKGEIIKHYVDLPSEPRSPMTCEYEYKKAKPTNSKVCPAYDDLYRGATVYSRLQGEPEMPVPPERDPRK